VLRHRAITFSRDTNDLIAVRVGVFGEREGKSREGLGDNIIDGNAVDDLMALEGDQIFGSVFFSIFSREKGGVFGTHDEVDESAGVTENGRADFLGDLGDILIGEN
jgi:hypothetical protein